MRTITISLESSLAAERVLAAAVDFSDRRSKIFKAVEPDHFEVHALNAGTADVTEGTGTGIGVSWERCRYDWSKPGQVTAPVTDSNVYTPGSAWIITATPAADGGGSHVEMSWVRSFKRSARGLLFRAAFRTLGRRLFGKYAQEILDNLEALEDSEVRNIPS